MSERRKKLLRDLHAMLDGPAPQDLAVDIVAAELAAAAAKVHLRIGSAEDAMEQAAAHMADLPQSQRNAAKRAALEMVEHTTGADARSDRVAALRLVLAAAIDAGTRHPG